MVKTNKVFGKFGNNYPEHISKVEFLGLGKKDLVSLAFLRPGRVCFSSKVSWELRKVSRGREKLPSLVRIVLLLTCIIVDVCLL